MQNRKKRFWVGSVYLLLGVLALAAAIRYDGNPFDVSEGSSDLIRLGIFTIAYFVLSFRSVEVNDRMLASATPMVVLTAGVVFAASGSTPVAMVAVMAAFGPFVPADFRQRRIFLPVFNFGQLILSAAAAGLVLDLILPELVAVGGRYVVSARDLATIVVGSVAAAIAYTTVNTVAVRVGAWIVYGARELVPWSGMATLLVSQLMMGALGGLLGAVVLMGGSSMIALVMIVFVIGHVVFTSYSSLREAHESTLKGFILALEARDLYTRGHTERVAYFCRLIGEELAFTGTQLERMRWAAIIHDMGKLAIPVEIMEKQGRLTDQEYRALRRASHKVDDLLSEVAFLSPMVQICSGAHPRLSNEDFGQTGHTHTTRPTLEQKVLAVADAFDAMTSTRGYRMAFSQSKAFSTLRDDETPLYDNDVIDALERGLASVGRTYGPPEIIIEKDRTANA